ncbi:hypothetical protein [Dapis sp. BLCC M229]
MFAEHSVRKRAFSVSISNAKGIFLAKIYFSKALGFTDSIDLNNSILS